MLLFIGEDNSPYIFFPYTYVLDLIPSLRGLGNAQERTLHRTDLPNYPSTLCPSSVRSPTSHLLRGWGLFLRLGRCCLTSRLHSASAANLLLLRPLVQVPNRHVVVPFQSWQRWQRVNIQPCDFKILKFLAEKIVARKSERTTRSK